MIRYTLTDVYAVCIEDCREYANNWEQDSKDYACCLASRCDGSQDACNDVFCKQRLAAPCDTIELDDCDWSTEKMNAWLAGEAIKYFKEIDPKFSYSFVARSNEDVLVDYSITSHREGVTTKVPGERGKFFYTMVKIFLEETGLSAKPVYEGVVHQRGFQEDFSINSATLAPANFFDVGKRYKVRLFYFIPQIPGQSNPNMHVDSMQLIIVRNRE
jgi:hypothetical protein